MSIRSRPTRSTHFFNFVIYRASACLYAWYRASDCSTSLYFLKYHGMNLAGIRMQTKLVRPQNNQSRQILGTDRIR